METKTNVIVMALCSILVIEQCIGVIVERDFKHGGRMIMICSSENVSIEIDTEEADADIARLFMTCEMMKDIDIWYDYLLDTSIGPSQGGAVTADVALRQHSDDITPGSNCTVHGGYYHLSAHADLHTRYALPSMTCTIPAIPPQLTNVTVTEGDDLNLTCINNNPSGVSQEWLDSEGYLVSTDATYTVENVTRNATGVYTCVLTGVNNYTERHNATVEVQYAPELYAQGPSNHTVIIRGNVSLSCTYDGVPTPMVQWVHNGVEVMNDAENVEISNDDGRSVLVLRNVGLGSGGNYTCEVGNSMGHNLLSFTVTIITEEVASTFTEGIDLGATTVATHNATSNESTSDVTPTGSESNLLVMAGILIPTLLFSSLAAATTVLVLLCHRWWKARKFNSYRIHFHLHSELDSSYVPVKVEVKHTFSQSMETILNARSYSDDNVKCYSMNGDDLEDTESVTSQRLSELSILKPDSLIGYCSGAAVAYDDNTSEHTQTNNICSHHLDIDSHEPEETTRVSSVQQNMRQDYVCIDIMHQSVSETENHCEHLGDSESECGSEYYHDGESLALNIESDSDATSLQDSEVLCHMEHTSANSNELVLPTGYITSDDADEERRARVIPEEASFIVGGDSLSLDDCTNDSGMNDTNKEQKHGGNLGNVASDFDITILESHTESFNQWKPRQLALDDTNHSSTDGYVPEPGMASNNFDLNFVSSTQPEPSGYIASDESGYYSSQIPSECDSSYKLRQLEDEDFLVLGTNEGMSHPVQEHSLITLNHCTLNECDRQLSITGDAYLQDTMSSPQPPPSSNMGTITEYIPNENISSHFQTTQDESRSQTPDVLWYAEEGDKPVIIDAAVPLKDVKLLPPLSCFPINIDHLKSLNNDDKSIITGTDEHTSSTECSSSYVVQPKSTSFNSTKISLDTNSLHPVHSNTTTCVGEHSTNDDVTYTIEDDFDHDELIEPSSSISCARENSDGYIQNEP